MSPPARGGASLRGLTRLRHRTRHQGKTFPASSPLPVCPAGPQPCQGDPKRDPKRDTAADHCKRGTPKGTPLLATAQGGGPQKGPLPATVAAGPATGPQPPPQTRHGWTLKRDARPPLPRGDPTKDTYPPQRHPQGLRAGDKARAARTSHPTHRGPGRARSSTQGKPRRSEALPRAPRTPDPRPHRRSPGRLRQPPITFLGSALPARRAWSRPTTSSTDSAIFTAGEPAAAEAASAAAGPTALPRRRRHLGYGQEAEAEVT